MSHDVSNVGLILPRHYWRNEQIHNFVPEDRARESMHKPFWLMEAPLDD